MRSALLVPGHFAADTLDVVPPRESLTCSSQMGFDIAPVCPRTRHRARVPGRFRDVRRARAPRDCVLRTSAISGSRVRRCSATACSERSHAMRGAREPQARDRRDEALLRDMMQTERGSR